MATRSQKRVSRTVKKETSLDEPSMLDEQLEDDALERAENLLKSKKQKVRSSPVKLKQANRSIESQEAMSDDESGENESYDSEMNDFIADDEEVEAEMIEAHKMKHKKKRRKPEQIKALDDEDVDLIRENVGIEVKKKSRLKRTATLVKQEESVQIDTKVKAEKMEVDSKVKKQRMEIEEPRQLNADRLKQAQNIFGESHELLPKQDSKPSNLKEFFNLDEIDDPFNTEADLIIAKTDLPERLQIKLENRLSELTEAELLDEAKWVLERLTQLPDVDNKYGKMIHASGTLDKVKKVIKMFRNEKFDIPMICKYRKYEYAPELDEDAVWHIFNLDQEFGKFQKSKAQVYEFLQKVFQFDQKIRSYIDELSFAKSMSELNNFNALIRFLRYQYSDQLTTETEDMKKHKQPQSRDEIQIARANRINELARLCFLECCQFQENLQYRKLTHQPPEPKSSPAVVAAEFASRAYTEQTDLLQAMCRYAALELASQPQIRNMMKKQLREHGIITCDLTEQGGKDLDIFHQSYRVKLVEQMPLKQLMQSDVYLDVLQCEKTGLVHARIEIQSSKLDDFRSFLEECYMNNNQSKESWNLFRKLVIKILVDEILNKELVKEIRDEIQQEAETFVINNCKRSYQELLMTGPFQTSLTQGEAPVDIAPIKNKRQEEIIKPKDRLCVMGALMHQIDANNYIVTIAVVDKYGELIAHKDFMRLLPPRIKKPRQQPGQPIQDPLQQDRPKTDEELEHERDKAKLIDILELHSVDLIVVAANGLEARTLKRVMNELGFELKNKKPSEDLKKVQSVPKEAFVIWGNPEYSKLFSLSHNSQKLHKGVQQILKQTISLARFEQDPLNELLNLWSPITAENQALALSLDPMQKLVNQSRLAEGLEEVNIRVVNRVGVDLNLVIDHEHMHSVLQFLSGLGPRMAKKLLAKSKALGKKLATRGEMLKSGLVEFKIYFSLVPFVLIRISEEDFGKNQVQKFDILDQTRIHHEHYKLAMKIATDACFRSDGIDDTKEVDKTEQNRKCKEVIARPSNLKNLDLKAYYQQLDMTNQGNMRIAIDHIIEEFKAPFADPRQPRTLTNLSITDEKLFYLLIDESKRTFKRGLIVTATVTNVLESKAICRLENGLTATIIKEKILDPDSQEKLRDKLDVGYIITGRVDRILTDEGERKFEVQLNCKKGDLHYHEKYLKDLADSFNIDVRLIKEEDKKNLNFAEDQKPKLQGRFTPRRIAHERFKNISSRRALAELQEAEVGEFVFRPSTRSEDAITLTWKFWHKQFVHIDIQELDKQPGAAIGQRLMLSNESYDNLREIVERYIIPCNRLVREVTASPKWCDDDTWEKLEETLKDEKNSDRGRIPYRFAILGQYQQHIVLAYVPREKVIKEFIKIRPKGYYFHDQNFTPFMTLVNWFKDQWQTKDYQRQLRRQKSPRTTIKAAIKETPAEPEFGQQWQQHDRGGNSVYSNHGVQAYSNIKQEQARSYGRGQRNQPAASPGHGGWGDSKMKYETGGKSPAGWQQDVPMLESYGQPSGSSIPKMKSNTCFKCQQEGHMARDCPNQGGNRGDGQPRRGCFNCGEDGHMSRECPQPQKERGSGRSQECFKCHQFGHMSRDCPAQSNEGFKRQRMDDGNSLRRNAEGGYDLRSTGGWGDDN